VFVHFIGWFEQRESHPLSPNSMGIVSFNPSDEAGIRNA
jgi:hypothetical protein